MVPAPLSNFGREQPETKICAGRGTSPAAPQESQDTKADNVVRMTETVGQAARVPGVTPAAVSLLLVHLKKRSLKRKIA